jgi:hypothetical protein
MRDDKVSRRGALRVLGTLPLLGVGAGAVLTGCGKKTEPDSCSDVSALNDAEKTARSALQYTDRSPHGDKRCDLCNLYLPASDVSQCGGCQIVKGPIHPKGYCTAYVPKAGA